MTLFRITPLVPEVKKEPFDDPDYTYELKYDGFRCVAYLQNGRCTTRTREDKYHNRFRFLEEELPGAFDKRKVTDAIFDGEAVALNVEGRPIFNEMMKFGKEPTYIAFDILFLNGKDLRTLPLIERRKILARVIPKDSNIVKRVFYEDARGIHFFSSICKIDLEGMVAKKLSDPYHRLTKWYKVINPTYSQMVGRAEMFNKFRKKKTLN